MRTYLILLAVLLSAASWGQETQTHTKAPDHETYVRHSLMPSVSLGFIDGIAHHALVLAQDHVGFVPV